MNQTICGIVYIGDKTRHMVHYDNGLILGYTVWPDGRLGPWEVLRPAFEVSVTIDPSAVSINVADAGHKYLLPSFDGGTPQTLTFMKREGEGFPGNVGHYPGTNLQSVLRACLDRVLYLQGQIPHDNNLAIVCHLKHCLRELEQRAAERHGFNPCAISLDLATFGKMCATCGHVLCSHATTDLQTCSREAVE